MLTNNVEELSNTIDISFVQRIIFYIILFLIPWFVIPLPWDSTELIRSTAFIVLSSFIILLEIIKWVWDGKVTITKSTFDLPLLLFLGSFVLSTIFAADRWIALWGFDARLGLGFIGMSFLIVFFFLSRGFVTSAAHVLRSVESFALGISVLIVMSLLSFLKMDVFSWIPYVKDFFLLGLPLTFSVREIVLITCLLVFFGIFLAISYIKEKRFQSLLFPFLILSLSFVAIPIFSVNQGAALPILFFVVMMFTSLILFMKLEKPLRFLPAMLSILSILMIVFAVGFQNESFKSSILGSSFEVYTPLELGTDISWNIASTSLIDNVFKSFVGIGTDSFSIAYSVFKPATESVLSLGNVSFLYASNEVFTTLTNRGLIGFFVWMFIGFVLLKMFIADITSEQSFDKKSTVIVTQLGLIFLYLGSFVVPYSFLVYFIFFVLLLLLIMLRALSTNENEQFLLKFWAVNVGKVSQNTHKTINTVNWSLTGILILIAFAGFISITLKTLSTAYMLRAEAFTVEQGKIYEGKEDISIEEREAYLNRLISYYQKARSYDSSNPVTNRKASLAAIEVMNTLSERYESASDEEKSAILSEISIWKNTAIDLSREAVNTSPYTYSNWYVRSTVYIGLISIGLSDYSEDALFSLQRTVGLNPLDFESYYRAGQIYMIKEDYELSLSAFNTVLSINGQHVPSLILSARILAEKGEGKTAVSYLEAAKKILELNKQEETELYSSVVNSLNELGEYADSGEFSGEDLDFDLDDDFSPL